MNYNEPDADCRKCGEEMDTVGVGEGGEFLEWLYRCPECDAAGSFYWTKSSYGGRPDEDSREERGAAMWPNETDRVES